jgi:hypothetical protein
MTSIVSGVNYTLLLSGESASNATAAILSALFTSSNTPNTTFVSTGNPITDLGLAQKEATAGVAEEAKQPQVARAITAFQAAVAHAPTIQAALANPAVQQVLLTANGLSSYIGETALVQKILLSDTADANSLVNKMANPTWLNTVKTYNFATTGLQGLQDPTVMATLANDYAAAEWRQGLDQVTPGLSNALTFLDQASAIRNAYDVLGNRTNFDVVTTALGIPTTIVFQDQPSQVNQIDAHLNYAKLQDRGYVTSLTDQYLLAMQQQKAASAGSGSSLTSLAVKAGGLLA